MNKNIESSSSYKNFGAGGVELVELMDKKIRLSETLSGLKSKGIPLDSIVKGFVSEWITNPASIRATNKNICKNDKILGYIGLKELNLKACYRAVEIIGKHADQIQMEITENMIHISGIDLKSVYSDWSSSFFCGKKCKIAKKGYSRDHRPEKEQVKIGLAISGSQTIPLYHSVLEGNVQDAPHFRNDFARLRKVLPKGALIIFDKGADCKENRASILNEECHFLTAEKMHGPLKRRIEKIDESKMQEVGQHKDGKKIYAYEWLDENLHYTLYLDERKFASDREKCERNVAKALKEYEKIEQLLAKRGTKAVQKKLSKKIKRVSKTCEYIIQQNISVQKRLAPKKDLLTSLEKDSDMDGKFVLVSSKKINPKKKLRLYRKKDAIEKMISDIKSVMNLRPFRVWNEDEVRGCVLLKIIAILMIAILQMENEELQNTSKSTIVNMLKNLTVVIKTDYGGVKTTLGYANTTEILVKILNLGT